VVDLYCRTDGCNTHDFKINAGGVCAYVDYMWLQEQMIKNPPPQQMEFDGFRELEQRLSQGEVFEYHDPDPPPKPPIRSPKSSNGGGVPL